MADPTIVTLGRDSWVKAASAVTNVLFDLRAYGPEDIYVTYRMTGGSAPSVSPLDASSDATIVSSTQLVTNTTQPIDVYFYAQGYGTTVKVSK